MKKKERAIVFTASADLCFAIACVMLDIKRISPNIVDEIVIIHDGISKKDQKLLSTIYATRFILYDFPVKDTSIFNQDTLNYFTPMVFAKFECFRLLNEYKQVLLTDSDVVIQGDISELFEYCEPGFKIPLSRSPVKVQFHTPISSYDMDKPSIAAGIFVLQDHLVNYNEIHEYCYRTVVKYASNLRLPEQAIFELAIQDFNIEISPLNRDIYSPHPTELQLCEKAKIIHSYGQPKFWNGLTNLQWQKNYNFWLKLGGTKFQKPTLSKRFLNKIKSIGLSKCFH